MIFKKIYKRKNFYIFISAIIFVCSTSIFIYKSFNYRNLDHVQIQSFDYKRDADHIVDLFKKNYYWLTANPGTSPENMVKTLSSSEDPQFTGKLTIKVLYEAKNFAGFIAYYKKSFYLGYIMYLGVYQELRGKGYGEKLVKSAIEDLTQLKSKKIKLITRPTNTAARNLYSKVGFEQTGIDDTYVYLEMNIN